MEKLVSSLRLSPKVSRDDNVHFESVVLEKMFHQYNNSLYHKLQITFHTPQKDDRSEKQKLNEIQSQN